MSWYTDCFVVGGGGALKNATIWDSQRIMGLTISEMQPSKSQKATIGCTLRSHEKSNIQILLFINGSPPGKNGKLQGSMLKKRKKKEKVCI